MVGSSRLRITDQTQATSQIVTSNVSNTNTRGDVAK